MNALNLARACAERWLTEPDPTKWSAADRAQASYALTNGLFEYWARAPYYITCPENLEGTTLASGESELLMPAGFSQVVRRLRIRTAGATTEDWTDLTLAGIDPVTNAGAPLYYRVLSRVATYDNFADTLGQAAPDYLLKVLPAADKDYDVDLQIGFDAPVVAPRHLVSLANTIIVPLSDSDCINLVVPMCGRGFWRHPLRRQGISRNDVDTEFKEAVERAASKPSRLVTLQGNVGTPMLY